MSHYLHLTQYERYQISALLRNHTFITTIARILNRHRSTIYRELNINKRKRGYRPQQTDRLASERKAHNQSTLTPFFWHYVEHLITQYYSPEQIHGRLIKLGWKNEGSIESIYQYIYKDKRKYDLLRPFLRRQKTYRKRHFKQTDRRGQLVNRRCIDERPNIVEQRIRFGDFEGDTIVGKGHQGVLLTMVDRMTRMTKIKGLPNRKADLVAQHSIQLLKSWNIASITFDNGKEFTSHELISQYLKTDIYFAHPYHSWERGTNENTNGLIRQFFKKRSSLAHVTDEEVRQVENLLNNRPRKVLGYLTPFEALAQNDFVALHG